jgi:hypothetical protein
MPLIICLCLLPYASYDILGSYASYHMFMPYAPYYMLMPYALCLLRAEAHTQDRGIHLAETV